MKTPLPAFSDIRRPDRIAVFRFYGPERAAHRDAYVAALGALAPGSFEGGREQDGLISATIELDIVNYDAFLGAVRILRG